MANAKRNNTTSATASARAAATGNGLTLAQWRQKLQKAVKAEQSAAARILAAVIEARGAFDLESKKSEKAVREAAMAAFTGAGNDKRTAQKRVADAVAILKAPSLPEDLPQNLQRAADAVRKARPKSEKRAAQQAGSTKRGKAGESQPNPGEGDEPAADTAKPVDRAEAARVLLGTIDGLAKRAADQDVVDMLQDLRDMLNS
jgi:rubrerythrin